jgi:hypothetical protein
MLSATDDMRVMGATPRRFLSVNPFSLNSEKIRLFISLLLFSVGFTVGHDS